MSKVQRPKNQYVSDELFHFVGRHVPPGDQRYQLLVKVLRSGRLESSTVAAAQTQRKPNPDAKLVVGEPELVPALCFCDIPRGFLSLHTEKYSQFGVSFKKKFLARRGAKPVIYVPGRSRPVAGKGTREQDVRCKLRRLLTALRSLQEIKKQTDWTAVDPNAQRLVGEVVNLQGFLANELYHFVKVFDEELAEDNAHNYYMEREWRIVSAGSKTTLEFAIKDIHAVMVPQRFRGRLLKQFPDLSSNTIHP